MSENPVRLWCKSTGKIIGPNSSDKTATHFMLDGGKLDLSEDYDTFQEIYAKYYNHKNCIVENKTKFFKFFIDFDVLTTEDFDIDLYVKTIQNVLKHIYNLYNKCIICCTDKDKIIIKEDQKYTKKVFIFIGQIL